jgi:hypothetical protein
LLRDGIGLLRVYARERRATFPEWCTEEGLFNIVEEPKSRAPFAEASGPDGVEE